MLRHAYSVLSRRQVVIFVNYTKSGTIKRLPLTNIFYQQVHCSPSQSNPIDFRLTRPMFWPFSSNSRTSVSEADLVDLRGKVAIVTGSNAGIGYSTVQFLARKGAKVYMAARSEAKALEAIKQLEAEDLWGGQVEWLRLDLSDMKQTKEAALEIFEKEKRLDILGMLLSRYPNGEMDSLTDGDLVNNAAMVVGPFKKTADGLLDIMVVKYVTFDLWESTHLKFISSQSHISHFIFTMTLVPLMKQTSNESPLADVRIINVTSEVHQIVPPVATFAGEGCLSHQYEESVMGYLRTYGYTKLANILFTKELQRRLSLEGFTNIVCIAAHPGSVTTPGSQRFMGSIPYISWITKTLNSWFSYPQRAGAFTSVFAAASPEVKAEPEKYRGAYLIPVARIAKPSKNAQDERLAKELWETTEAKLKELSML
ncbi:hypothetical protein D9613_012460 [Agrocybe pediades]|uniref:NAD(P)-binding protein n=1 Tax=Agrocybe pediades TaxID=84607 RepID=A0A8H4VPY7_9AGAR|nr:hypothetical protein D9613_012460 [Agrocybe pediades]